ncbi:class V aminotransferase [Gorgonomyces haynaldii]|nr:class V aminotransferase [Gorgonomyces haynaldii]
MDFCLAPIEPYLNAPDQLKDQEMLPLIRQSIFGSNQCFKSPLGPRKAIYCDYFASGRSLGLVENFMSHRVLPSYANTHTDTSFFGKRTSDLREQARKQIQLSVNGYHSKEKSAVIFCGSGSTSAVNMLVHMLGLEGKSTLAVRLQSLFLKRCRTVVFVSIQEHHANILPWRMTGVKVVFVGNDNGIVSLVDLEHKLRRWKESRIICSFSAGSNVTGILNPVHNMAQLVHKYGGLCFIDYAGVGSYCPIDVNPKDKPEGYLDGIYLSPHKMLGGPGTTGILVIREALLQDLTKDKYNPLVTGGGIVDFVCRSKHKWIQNPVHREEAGTPAILESIRCGLVFRLKDIVGADYIMRKEYEHFEYANMRLEPQKSIVVLGPLNRERLPVFSFLIKDLEYEQKGLPCLIHYQVISAALNDFFGIQARGGCACAGPYAQHLTGMPKKQIDALYRLSNQPDQQLFEIMKPGFTRLSFNYFDTTDDMDFVIDAIIWIARHARTINQFYNLNGSMIGHQTSLELCHEQPKTAQECFHDANLFLQRHPPKKQRLDLNGLEHLQWFIY